MLTNELFSYLHLDYSRGKKVAKKLIGNFIGRIIVSNRYPAYDFLPEYSHQVCWSHLKRDFQKISERSGISGVIGRRLLQCYGKIFAFWKVSLKQPTDDKRTRKKRTYSLLLSCKQQNKKVLSLLQDTIRCHFKSVPAPLFA